MRVLLDTNILLDGVFLRNSNSFSIIKFVQSSQINAYVTKNVLIESWERIKQLEERYNVEISDFFRVSLRS